MEDDVKYADLVAEIFEETNSLQNIPALRKKLLREKSHVDTQLQTGIQVQMQMLADGMHQLKLAQGNVHVSGDSLAEMSDLYAGSIEHVPGFDDTQAVAKMLANFDLTEKLVAHFDSYQQQINLVVRLMKSDGEFDIDNPMPNLVPTHYILNQLLQVKEDAVSYLRAKDSTSDTRLTLRRLYEPLDQLVAQFDETLLAISEDLLETLRANNRSLVVRFAKIVEMEEKQDIIVKFSQKQVGNQGGFGGRTQQQQYTRQPRRILERCFESIESSIKSQFDNCMSAFPPDTEPKELLKNLQFVNNELVAAKDYLSPCCPERWQIFKKFVLWYHRGVYRVLETILRFEPPAETLLELLRYVKEYYANLSKAFGITRKATPELLDPPLVDGRERDLYDDYLGILTSKLKQWYNTIWAREKHDFEHDIFHAEYYSNGVGLETHTMVTKLISQQLEVAAESGQARVISGCVDACCEIVAMRQQDWIKMMRDVTRKATSGDPDAPHGLYEYLFVIANDQERAYNFLDEQSEKWSPQMPPRYHARVTERFAEAQEGYQDVTKECFINSLSIIYSDIRPALNEVFKSDKWYKGVTIQAIIDTYADFVADAKKLLLDDLFEIFMGKLCSETVLWYLRAMGVPQKGASDSSGAVKTKKLNMPRGRDRILEDAKGLFEFFTQCGCDPDTIRKVFYIFDVFVEVLTVPLDEVPSLFSELRSRERDAPLALFEYMLGLRKDVDSKLLKEVMTNVRGVAMHTDPINVESEELGHSFLYEFSHHD